jgi:hypothetical protein
MPEPVNHAHMHFMRLLADEQRLKQADGQDFEHDEARNHLPTNRPRPPTHTQALYLILVEGQLNSVAGARPAPEVYLIRLSHSYSIVSTHL